ncbi:MAG: LuxR C-terminal-related transcriptional regulator [Sandaracinaceae bacterium]|nr:LuxR C-terminal-related transcriptional regulator [Sandaracinaceae bacterium]
MASTGEGKSESVRTMHADAMAVLGNLDMFERAGVATSAFWESLGLSRHDAKPGLAVPWDLYARFAERAIETVGADRIDATVRELSLQFRGHWAPQPTTREALRFLLRELAPAVWPCLDMSIVDTEAPRLTIRVSIPEPLHAFAGWHRMNAMGLAGFPIGMGLPEVRLLDLAVDETGRHAVYLFELPDELLGADGLAPATITHADATAVFGNTDMLERAGVSSPERGIEDAPSIARASDPVTHVEAIAVLSNLEVFERLGVPSRPFWDELGIDPLDVKPGAHVPWDPYARFFEDAIARVGEERVAAAVRAMPRQYQAHWPKQSSMREALRFVATELTPMAWPCLRTRFLELAPPFCAIEIVTPPPLRPAPAIQRIHGIAFAAGPPAMGLPEATLIGSILDDDDRRGLHIFVLDDERVEVPLGELGNKVRGNYCLAFVDMCVLAGVDVRGWMSRHHIDRDGLIAGDLLEWRVIRELFELAEPEVGGPALRQASQHFADLTRPRSQRSLPLDPYAMLEFVHSTQLLTDGWGVLAPASVQRVGARHALIHVPMRKDTEGSSAVFRAHLYALESVTPHVDLPPPRTVASRIDDREGIYVVELPVVPHPGAVGQQPDGPTTSKLATKVVEGVYRERVEARASMVERLGREVARRTDVHSIAEVLTRDLRDHLEAEGVEIRLFVDGDDMPLRMHGAREGSLLTRAMEYGGQSIGAVRVWCDPPSAGAILAVLDVMMPWVGVAFGTAIERADASASLASSRAERDAIRDALASVLTTHPHAVFVLDARGHVEPANAHAMRRLAAEGAQLLERIAEAVGTGSAAFDVHPVRHNDQVDRLVVIERPRGALSVDDRVQLAVTRLGLTERQADVVLRMSRGLSNKEIASELSCSEVTVEKHLTAAFKRAGVTGRTQLAAKLWESR